MKRKEVSRTQSLTRDVAVVAVGVLVRARLVPEPGGVGRAHGQQRRRRLRRGAAHRGDHQRPIRHVSSGSLRFS